MSKPSFVLDAWRRMSALPLGKRAFTRMVCFKAPYFGSIHPRFEELQPWRCVTSMRKRRSVTNHLGTVHAIAMCNLAELTAGVMVDASLPATHRWIPKGMTVEYLRKAGSDLRAEAAIDPAPLFGDEGTGLPVTVTVTDRAGEPVFRAVITMWVSPKPMPKR